MRGEWWPKEAAEEIVREHGMYNQPGQKMPVVDFIAEIIAQHARAAAPSIGEFEEMKAANEKLEARLDRADRLVMRLEGKIESLEDALGAHRASIKERP